MRCSKAIFIGVLVGFISTGCTTAMYEDKSLSDSEIALITTDELIIKFVDQVKVPYSGGNFAKIKVLPGIRAVTVELNDVSNARSAKFDQTVTFKAEAGHQYLVSPLYEDPFWNPMVMDQTTGNAVESEVSVSREPE